MFWSIKPLWLNKWSVWRRVNFHGRESMKSPLLPLSQIAPVLIEESEDTLKMALVHETPEQLNNKHVFATFANTDFMATDRIVSQAKDMDVLNQVYSYDETHIPNFINNYRSFIDSNKIGYGRWIWKPYIILKTLNQLADNQILLYCDAGVYLNAKGRSRYYEYMDMLDRVNSDVLVFEAHPYYKAEDWIKRDIVMGYYPKFYNVSRRYCYAGLMMVKNTTRVQSLISEWLGLCSLTDNLINARSRIFADIASYRGNDADNGIFNLCLAKYSSIVKRIHYSESNIFNADGSEMYDCIDWSSLDDFPLQCRRLRP